MAKRSVEPIEDIDRVIKEGKRVVERQEQERGKDANIAMLQKKLRRRTWATVFIIGAFLAGDCDTDKPGGNARYISQACNRPSDFGQAVASPFVNTLDAAQDFMDWLKRQDVIQELLDPGAQ